MNKEYREWWIFEGSGMRPLPEEDMEQFAMRIAEIAWSRGAKDARFLAADDAWMELVKHGIGWKLRKAVTDAIHARDEQ